MLINNGPYIDFIHITKVWGDDRYGHAAAPGEGKCGHVLHLPLHGTLYFLHNRFHLFICFKVIFGFH